MKYSRLVPMFVQVDPFLLNGVEAINAVPGLGQRFGNLGHNVHRHQTVIVIAVPDRKDGSRIVDDIAHRPFSSGRMELGLHIVAAKDLLEDSGFQKMAVTIIDRPQEVEHIANLVS